MLTLTLILAIIAFFRGTTPRSSPLKPLPLPSAMKTAIVIGSTGLVGSELVRQLQSSPQYVRVVLLNRRASGAAQPKIEERTIDFDAPDLTAIAGDDFYCALGTTRRKAGSEEAQYRIDCEYPAMIATRLRNQGVKRVFLVSSLGADAKAGRFYLRTKGRLEERIIGLGFERTVIVRPFFLLGRKTEFRLGEETVLLLAKLFAPFLIGRLRKYQGVEARAVAECLVRAAHADTTGVRWIESDKIQAGE